MSQAIAAEAVVQFAQAIQQLGETIDPTVQSALKVASVAILALLNSQGLTKEEIKDPDVQWALEVLELASSDRFSEISPPLLSGDEGDRR